MDGARPDPSRDAVGEGVDRRSLLARAAAIAAALAPAGLAGLSACAERVRRLSIAPTPVPAGALTFTREQWRTLAAALERLLPSAPGEPGAREVNAIGYLDAVLVREGIEPEDPARMATAASRLDAQARERGAASFADLAEADRDAALLRLQKADPEGKRCVERLLYYDLEALLGDPAHGGNPGEIGWTWLGHVPGEPRPPKYGGGLRR
jgi:gluconate 2-dehydrogenase gamma chain